MSQPRWPFASGWKMAVSEKMPLISQYQPSRRTSTIMAAPGVVSSRRPTRMLRIPWSMTSHQGTEESHFAEAVFIGRGVQR